MDSPMYYEVIYIIIICLRTYVFMSVLRFYQILCLIHEFWRCQNSNYINCKSITLPRLA